MLKYKTLQSCCKIPFLEFTETEHIDNMKIFRVWVTAYLVFWSCDQGKPNYEEEKKIKYII